MFKIDFKRMKTVLPIFVLLVIKRSITVVHACVPAEEGTDYVLTAPVLDRNTHTQWSRNDDVIGSCNIMQACQTTSKDFSITFENNNRFKSKLTIHNVTRAPPMFAESVWKLMDATQLRELYVCDLKVYAGWTQPTCSLVIDADGMNMTCSLRKTYPSINCNKELFRDAVEYHQLGQMKVVNDPISSTLPLYYYSWCSLFVAREWLRTGLYTFNLYLKPKFADSYFHQHLVHRISLKRQIDKPIVYVDANYTIQNSGKFVLNCVCKLSTSGGEIDSEIKWYHRRPNGTQAIDSSVISFEMEDNVEEYYCQAGNVLEMQSSEVKCKFSHKYNTTSCPQFLKYQNISKALSESATITNCLPSVFKLTEEFYIDDRIYPINKPIDNIAITLREDKNVQTLTIVVSNLTKSDFRRYDVQIKFISGNGVTYSFIINQVSETNKQESAYSALMLPFVGSVSFLCLIFIFVSIYCIKVKRCTSRAEAQAKVNHSHLYSVPSDSHLYMTVRRANPQISESDDEHYIDIDRFETIIDGSSYDHYITVISGGSNSEELPENQYITIDDYEYIPSNNNPVVIHENIEVREN